MGPRRFLLVGITVLMTVPLIAVVAGGFWLYDDLAVSSRDLPKTRALAEELKIPLSLDDMDWGEGPSGGGDALPVLKQMSESWGKVPSEEQRSMQLAYRTLAMGGEKRASFDRDLQSGAKLLGLMKQAAAKPDIRFERDWTEPGKQGDYFAALYQVARLGCNQAMIEARRGDVSAAFGTLKDVRRAGRHLSRRSDLSGLTLHITVEQLALTHAEQILLDLGDKPEVRTAFRQFVKDWDSKPDVLENVEAEALHANTVFGSPEKLAGGSYAGVDLEVSNGVLQKANRARMLEFWNLALPKVRGGAPSMIEMRDSYAFAVDHLLSKRGPSRVLTQSAVQNHLKILDSAHAIDVHYHIARVLADMVEWKAKNGAWSRDLAKAGGDVSDPCSDGDLNLVFEEKGFVLYSIGIDRVDDGGEPNSPSRISRDIVLRVEAGKVVIEGL